ncbi:MAG: 30S ribosomal protein S15 [Paracholeplasma sp.]|jgi:small subunit ribosomal protein S15|uniref:Small ribosomal subunit protein uS15 n=1 Tax=Acholeplasma brassicae TaxID=61635 RepID=U4KNS4_9MOLU|nr:MULTISPECIES: 30S ribosomal protein S15 [Paracholeplasma]MDY3196141.1 30S ribosomal protein S15 [Paracholeplasma sp.]CCV65916.1 30S ribosomal protein S15 [Paracholeplasma brassicae]HBT59494.1 30S ribosomal protein S15 [Acholeplasmataceae bacterium]
MALTKDQKLAIISEYATKDGDTGSAEVQIAILTKEINDLNSHLQNHIHDFHSKRGLFQKIGRRKRLMTYLKNKDLARYQALISKLGLRG